MNQFNIEVNKKTIKAQRGDTVLQTLRKNGIDVPTICNMKEFSPTGACRMCVVEVEGKEHLIPSCSHPVEEWMKIQNSLSEGIESPQDHYRAASVQSSG